MNGMQNALTDRSLAERERKRGAEILLGLALIASMAMLLAKPIHQSATYHDFHDVRALFGVPNMLNVVSNVPFLVIGIGGFVWLKGARSHLPPALRRAYAVMMAGTLLTGFGSGWYHLQPNHASLVMDRLPMAVAFTGFFVAMIGERVSLKAADTLLLPLLAFSVGSVLHWQAFDDLRPYVLVQFFPLLTIPFILWWFEPRYTRGGDIAMALGLYVTAKLFEAADGLIYSVGHIVSGHTIKHLIAAVAAWLLLRMLKSRALV